MWTVTTENSRETGGLRYAFPVVPEVSRFYREVKQMALKYDESFKGGERYIILSDIKQEVPTTPFKIVGSEERQKKDGTGTFPVLLLEDDHNKKYVVSAWVRDVDNLIDNWGVDASNWEGNRITIEKSGNRYVIKPVLNEYPSNEEKPE